MSTRPCHHQKFLALQRPGWLCLVLWLLSGCGSETRLSQLDQIRERQVLTIGTLYGPTTYFSNDHQASGMEFELAQQFAAQLGVELEVVASADLPSLFRQLDEGSVDLLATGLTITEQRRQRVRFGPPYYQVTQKLIFKQGQPRPRKLSDLDGSLMVLAGSSHAETLTRLQREHPYLSWLETRQYDPEEILSMLIDEKIDYTVVDSTILDRNRRQYPDLSLAFTIGEPQQIAWVLAQGQDDSLYSEVIDFFGRQQSDGLIAQLEEKYFGHVQKFDYVDTHAFIRATQEVLPQYQVLFERYAGDIGWLQLAATSYQESHWDPKARSYTGVRGMMMLTKPTAKQMGVKSRLDAEESIRGGARYLHRMLARLPHSIVEHERFWFALAAYNLGFGHLMDARKLASLQGKNPNSWTDVKQLLPLLEKRKYYKKTRHGFARGREAVHYVDNIRRYYETLKALELPSMQQRLAAEAMLAAAETPSAPAPKQTLSKDIVTSPQ